MSTHIALLRGINIGGHRRIAMADLRALLCSLGFGAVRSLLQSGNLVFDAGTRSADEIERLLEAETGARLGIGTDYMVRDVAELARIVSANPFPAAAADDPAHLVVMFLKCAARAAAVTELQAACRGPERLHLAGRELYVVYTRGIAGSALTAALIERKLGCRVTGRNWNTVLKLAALALA